MKFGTLTIRNLKCLSDSQISFRSWDSGTCICFTYLLIYLSLAVFGLHCCSWTFSSCGEWRLLSNCSAQTSNCGGFSHCRSQALGHIGFSNWGMQVCCPLACWDLPGLGIKPMSLAFVGKFLTTESPGKSRNIYI